MSNKCVATVNGNCKGFFSCLNYPEDALRGEAVQILHGLFLSRGATKFAIPITPDARTRIIRQLQKDEQSNLYFSKQAREILAIFESSTQ